MNILRDFSCRFFFFAFFFSLNKCITEDAEVGFFSTVPMILRESARQQPAQTPYATLPSGLQAFSAHTKCPCLEVVLMEPSSSLSPKENKDLQERGQTGNKLANSCWLQPQVAFNIGPKPLGNREVVTSIQVIFYFEETPQCHSHPPWKEGKAESRQQSESANTCGGEGEWPNKTTQQPSLHGHTKRPGSSAGRCPLHLMMLLKPWNWGNFDPTEKPEGPLAPASHRVPPLMPHITSLLESHWESRELKKQKKPRCFPFSLYRKTLARPISSFGIKCDSTVC